MELGRPRLTEHEAFRRFVAYLVWLMVSGRIGLLDGAQRIGRIPWYDAPEVEDLGFLAFLAEEWEGGWGRPQEDIETDMRLLAIELLARLDADDPLPR